MYALILAQICRVEDVFIEGFLEGSVVHFHWVRAVLVKSSGTISASGLGTPFFYFYFYFYFFCLVSV